MRLQLLSDLHMETESFDPRPAAGAELLVLAGDVDATWAGLERFAGWPVPVLFVAGNHEFDGRELSEAWPMLRARCESLGMRLLECESCVMSGSDGRRIRFVGTVRWCDFEAFGAAGRDRAQRAAVHFMRLMSASDDGRPFDVEAVRSHALRCRAWLAAELARPRDGWEATVAITHYAPSLRSADPRYGCQPGTASFCNADDDLLPFADLWLHGHLHCRHDYRVDGKAGRSARVVCNARGHGFRGEPEGFADSLVLDV